MSRLVENQPMPEGYLYWKEMEKYFWALMKVEKPDFWYATVVGGATFIKAQTNLALPGDSEESIKKVWAIKSRWEWLRKWKEAYCRWKAKRWCEAKYERFWSVAGG